MKKLLITLLFPLMGYSQDYWTNQENHDYFYIATEVDPRNLIFEGVNNTQGYNGILKFGYKYDWFKAEVFHEIYPNIDYSSTGVNIFFVYNEWKRLKPAAGLQLSVINRPTALVPSFGANGELEYHIGRFFVSGRVEVKYRSDLKKDVYYYGSYNKPPMKFSGLIGFGIKF